MHERIFKGKLHAGDWFPLCLLLLPTIMAIVPVIVFAPPGLAIRSTPKLPLLFQVIFIIYAARLGGFSWIMKTSLIRFVPFVSAVLLAIVVWTALWVAPNTAYSIEKLLDLALFAAIFLGGASIFQRGGPKLMRRTLMAIFGSLLLAVPLVSFLYWIRIPTYIAWPEVLPGFVFIRIYGFSLTVGISVGCGLLVLPRFQEQIERSVIICGLIMMWTALFWSGSRGGVVALLLGVPLVAVIIPRLRGAIFPALITMIAGAAISSLIPVPNQKFGFFNIWFELTQPASLDDFGTGRLDLWKQAWSLILERPWFGYGYAQHAYVASVADRSFVQLHSHNLVLDVLLAWGAVGAACLGFLMISYWLRGFRKTCNGLVPERIPAFLLVNVLLIYSMFDGAYFYYHAMIPLAFCIAILAANAICGNGSVDRQ